MAREAVDRHLQIAGALIDPKKGVGQKLLAALRAAAFYAFWYPSQWLGWGRWPRFAHFGALAGHVRFVERSTRKLARSIFYGMLVHRARLERKQAFLARIVDIAMDLFAMTASVLRAQSLRGHCGAPAREAASLADLFCRTTRRAIEQRFHALWRNEDALRYETGRAILAGQHEWLEEGSVGLGQDAEALAHFAGARPAEPAGQAPKAA
jgi:hypothetical protein